jgi:hypothetical protein
MNITINTISVFVLTWSTTQTLSFAPHANCGVTQCLQILYQAITFLAVDAIKLLAPPIKHFFTAVYFVTQTLISKLVIMSATSDLNTGRPETTFFYVNKTLDAIFVSCQNLFQVFHQFWTI